MAQPRSPKWNDGSLAGYNFRLKRDGEGRSYTKQFSRSNLPFNQSEEHDGKFNTRQDIRTLWQTSWSGGAFWNKPLISAASISTYYTSEGMDVVSSPGDLIPLPTATTTTLASGPGILWPGAIVSVAGSLYAATSVGTETGISKWGGSSWSDFTNVTNIGSVEAPVSMFHDQDADNFVFLQPDGDMYYIDRADTTDGTIIDIGVCNYGSNGFMHFGRMFVYNGDILQEVSAAYGGSATKATIYDDGMGPEYLTKVAFPVSYTRVFMNLPRLAVATAEGIYYVKNVEQEGVPTAFIYRIDRANDGTNIGTPIATLPPGMLALDVSYSLGSLLVSATSDVDIVMSNNLTNGKYPRIDIYHLTNGSLGSVGSPLGGDSPDEAPHRFAGTFGAKVYIGGSKRVWVYDMVNGGLHPLFDHEIASQEGAAVNRAFTTTDASGNRVIRFFDMVGNYHDLEIDTGTDNDSQTRSLTSNYFDFNIPAEKKTITHVTVMTDGPTANETWTVQLSADDGAFATAATVTSAKDNTEKQRITPVSGFRFQYKITYATSAATASPSRLKGIVFHALEGEMVAKWRLTIDGKEFRNVENLVVRPDTVLSNFEAVGGTDTVVSFVDEMKTSSSTHNVKVESVTVSRGNALEIDTIDVVLTEDT